MYAFIEGEIALVGETFVALLAGGVGYQIHATQRFLSKAEKGKYARLHTYLAVREDSMILYGFEEEREKKMFARMISVSGVGPKAAMAILSILSLEEINAAILAQDAKAFTRAPGVGAKMANRILLELKDKIEINGAEDFAASQNGNLMGATPAIEAAEALVQLGYSRSEAVSAVSKVKDLGDTAEEITLLALKQLSI